MHQTVVNHKFNVGDRVVGPAYVGSDGVVESVSITLTNTPRAICVYYMVTGYAGRRYRCLEVDLNYAH